MPRITTYKKELEEGTSWDELKKNITKNDVINK